jgi:C4-dicarboxylate-specific signal transduction histidine kinase
MDRTPDPDLAFLSAAGALASGVTSELHGPLRQIRESLAVLVETLDRHFAEATGPVPYPWTATKALRERLAETYLLCRAVTRTTGDLARAVAVARGALEPVDPNKLVEQAVGLARHRFGEERELDIDAGEVPAVRAPAGELVLLLATLLGEAATAGGAGALAVRTRRDGEVVVIQVSAAGATPSLAALAQRVLAPIGGELARPEGALEIRLPVTR